MVNPLILVLLPFFLLGFGLGYAVTRPVAPTCGPYTRIEEGTGWTPTDEEAEVGGKNYCLTQGQCLRVFDKRADGTYHITCTMPGDPQ